MLLLRHFLVSKYPCHRLNLTDPIDQLAVARFALSALRTMHSVLATNDQCHLYQTASRALAITRRRGDVSTLEYWGGHPVQSIAMLPWAFFALVPFQGAHGISSLPSHRIPVEKPVSLLATSSSTTHTTSIISGSNNDLFLYNPRKSFNMQVSCGEMSTFPFSSN